MSAGVRTTSVRRAHHGAAAAALALLAGLALTGCDAGTASTSSESEQDTTQEQAVDDAADAPPAGELVLNVDRGARVPVDTQVEVSATDAALDKVVVRSTTADVADVPGTMSADGAGWSADELLEPGATYRVKAVGTGDDGERVRRTTRFRTEPLTLDQQTYPSVAPVADQEVGVGMPVIVKFDVPVTDRAAFEKRMTVTSKPAQPGAWHWLSDYEAHWRPKDYWKAGTKVHVDVDVNGVDAGNGIYGQEDREVDFTVGDAHVYKVDMVSHQMKVFSNGELLRTIPITTGEQPAYTTRSGTKVIIEKFETKDMNSETVGITGSDAYNIQDVQWAMRLTYSGEFIHAAPWSVGSQGYANVSHGCTGMSTENAGWLYAMTNVGDVVEYTGSDRPMTLDNGYGDWNASFKDYRKASALS